MVERIVPVMLLTQTVKQQQLVQQLLVYMDL
jgi:hypothetical protein